MTEQFEPLELEGTWEEILTQSDKLAGHRVRVIILLSETETKQAIAIESQKELEQLNPNYLITCQNFSSKNAIRFGDLPQDEQASIRQALVSQARGELERWEFQ